MREESPLLRAARQAALGEPSTPALCIYVVRLFCYERFGKRAWSIYYQSPTGPRVYLLRCFAGSMSKADARARAALLCVRRPSEILALRPSDITDEGIYFAATKRKAGEAERRTLISWSDELRSTVAEAQAIERRVDISPLVFGNLTGGRYTKSGWGANWRRLMQRAA